MIIVIIGFIIWFAETAYFGFNAKPESATESFFDFLSAFIIGWGVIGDILSNVTIIKKTFNTFNETHNITTKDVKVTGKEPHVNYNFGTTKAETQRLLKLGRGDNKKADKK
jgi:uncharacterized membrane protein